MVFSVIVENIKSFFAKEEELEHDPKKLPRSASDVFEKPSPLKNKVEHKTGIISNRDSNSDDNPNKGLLDEQSEFHQKIVNRDLPKDNSIKSSKGLKYSSADLKEKLRAKQLTKSKEVKPTQTVREEPKHELITPDEIAAFEQAISGIDDIQDSRVVETSIHEEPSANIDNNYLSESVSKRKALEGGFFSEYEKHLNEKDYKLDPSQIDGEALIDKMHDYHSNKLQGKDYYIHKDEIENAIKKKISDLKEYEYEWFDLKERQESIKRAMTNVEDEIKKRSSELKSLVTQINSKVLITSPKKELDQEFQKASKEQESQDTQEIQEKLNNQEKVEQPKQQVEKIKTEKETNASEKVETNNNAFYLADGKVINNLEELKESLRNMPDSIFYQHVSPDRNDFANWIADSLKKEEVSLEIRKCFNKYEMINKLNHKWA